MNTVNPGLIASSARTGRSGLRGAAVAPLGVAVLFLSAMLAQPGYARTALEELVFDSFNQPLPFEVENGGEVAEPKPPVLEPVFADIDPQSVQRIGEAMESRGLSEPFLVKDYPLPNGERADVSFQAYGLWAPDGEVAVYKGEAIAAAARPRHLVQLLGVAGDDAESTILVRAGDSGLGGFVYVDGQLFGQNITQSTVTFVPGMPEGLHPEHGDSVEDFLDTLEPAGKLSDDDILAAFCCVGGPGGQTVRFFDLAIMTDDEFYQRHFRLGPVVDDVVDLVAALNVIYFRDSRVLLRLRWLGIYGFFLSEEIIDPYHGTTDDGVVRELHTIWNRDMAHVPRDMAVMLTGKSLGGSKIFMPWKCSGGARDGEWCDLFQPRSYASCGTGSCEWVSESLCDQERSYAVVTIGANPDSNINKLAHEIGHLFGAEHAHCTTLPGTGTYVDRCVSGGRDFRGNLCYSGPRYGPSGLRSSIMSYCGPPTYPYTLAFDPANAEVIRQNASTASCARQGTVTALQNGQAVSNLSSTPNGPGYNYFAIEVAPGATDLRIETSGGSGSLRLYARFGTLPTVWGTHSSTTPGTTGQSIVVPAPDAGTWYIVFYSLTQFSNISLEAEYQ